MSTNPAFGTEEQVSGGGATSLASVRRHVFACSEVCDGGALKRDASGAAARRQGPDTDDWTINGVDEKTLLRGLV